MRKTPDKACSWAVSKQRNNQFFKENVLSKNPVLPLSLVLWWLGFSLVQWLDLLLSHGFLLLLSSNGFFNRGGNVSSPTSLPVSNRPPPEPPPHFISLEAVFLRVNLISLVLVKEACHVSRDLVDVQVRSKSCA
jgi:hypothetical protein